MSVAQAVLGADCPKCGRGLWYVACAKCSAEHYRCDFCRCEWVWQAVMSEWVRFGKGGKVVEVIPNRAIGTLGRKNGSAQA